GLAQHQLRRLPLPWQPILRCHKVWQVHDGGGGSPAGLSSCVWPTVQLLTNCDASLHRCHHRSRPSHARLIASSLPQFLHCPSEESMRSILAATVLVFLSVPQRGLAQTSPAAGLRPHFSPLLLEAPAPPRQPWSTSGTRSLARHDSTSRPTHWRE